VLHHQDLANAVELALSGAIDSLVVNVAGDAPISAYEMAELTGGDDETSSKPLVNPWRGQVETSLARSLGFRPEVLTAYQASRENKL